MFARRARVRAPAGVGEIDAPGAESERIACRMLLVRRKEALVAGLQVGSG